MKAVRQEKEWMPQKQNPAQTTDTGPCQPAMYYLTINNTVEVNGMRNGKGREGFRSSNRVLEPTRDVEGWIYLVTPPRCFDDAKRLAPSAMTIYLTNSPLSPNASFRYCASMGNYEISRYIGVLRRVVLLEQGSSIGDQELYSCYYSINTLTLKYHYSIIEVSLYYH